MIVNVAVFDKNMVTDIFIKKNKENIRIISKNLCVTHNVRLKYKRDDVFVFNITKGRKGKFLTNRTDFSFGIIYQLEVEDFSLLSLVMSSASFIENKIQVGIIEGTIEDIANYTFKFKKFEQAYCWVCDENNEKHVNLWKYERHRKINVSKFILLSDCLKEK